MLLIIRPISSQYFYENQLSLFKHKFTTCCIRSGNVAAQLERETQALLTSLEEKVERRLYELRMPLATNVLKKIRLSTSDLKVFIK
jgi:hypothetical protein